MHLNKFGSARSRVESLPARRGNQPEKIGRTQSQLGGHVRVCGVCVGVRRACGRPSEPTRPPIPGMRLSPLFAELFIFLAAPGRDSP